MGNGRDGRPGPDLPTWKCTEVKVERWATEEMGRTGPDLPTWKCTEVKVERWATEEMAGLECWTTSAVEDERSIS